tara:strand:- start:22 stop:408 length:387 start_codon:yes stop_codon:yes gene_type:complete
MEPTSFQMPRKASENPAERVLTEVAKLNRRMSLIEDRINSLRDQIDLVESSLAEKHSSANSGISDVSNDVRDFNARLEELKQEIVRLSSHLDSFASKQDVQVLERYINFWSPLDSKRKSQGDKPGEET